MPPARSPRRSTRSISSVNFSLERRRSDSALVFRTKVSENRREMPTGGAEINTLLYLATRLTGERKETRSGAFFPIQIENRKEIAAKSDGTRMNQRRDEENRLKKIGDAKPHETHARKTSSCSTSRRSKRTAIHFEFTIERGRTARIVLNRRKSSAKVRINFRSPHCAIRTTDSHREEETRPTSRPLARCFF